ncbi:hypothetical protein JHK85_013662 [Glycine max]|nr:hypothetical protein JHK85_013662 [Glycine max]
MDRYANSVAPQDDHLYCSSSWPYDIVTPKSHEVAEILMMALAREGEGVGVACMRSLASPFTPTLPRSASTSRLDPVALSVLMSFMAIALPLVPLDDIIAMESHKAAKILVTVLARDGKGLGVVWCA